MMTKFKQKNIKNIEKCLYSTNNFIFLIQFIYNKKEQIIYSKTIMEMIKTKNNLKQ